jgi:hypothetical protein
MESTKEKRSERPRHAPSAAGRTMRAAVFQAPGRITLEERPVPEVGPTDADYDLRH